MPTRNSLRAMPSIDALVRAAEGAGLGARTGRARLTALARAVSEELRAELRAQGDGGGARQDAAARRDIDTRSDADARSDTGPRPSSTGPRSSANDAESASSNGHRSRESLLVEAVGRMARAVEREDAAGLRRVINATGVVLHTNLGRAPLSANARRALAEEAAGYCALEYDLASGARGRRGARAEQLLAELTGAEEALVVNNCAAAALLVLTALARGGETIVSRGELVEIGGDFRVPEVMAQSGTAMVEVGTTNRTKLSDYERAVSDATRMILRVHPSNYRVVGFTSTPSLAELAALAHARSLPLYEDAGSGALVDLSPHGLTGEPVISESIRAGADVVTFSGDKLLGAAQAGLVVGRRALVAACRAHPLYRALRADKLSLAALEATLDSYRRGAATREVPTLAALAATRDEIERRARAFIRRARARVNGTRSEHRSRAEDRSRGEDAARTGDGARTEDGLRGGDGARGVEGQLSFEIVEGRSAVGGGSAPTTHPPTALVAVAHARLTASALEEGLRCARPPVVARIAEDRVVLDLRTVAPEEEAEMIEALARL